MLPLDIAINEIIDVGPEAHARFDATKRTYHYFIHQKKLPFHQNDSWFFPRALSIEKMNEAAKYLLGRQDLPLFPNFIRMSIIIFVKFITQNGRKLEISCVSKSVPIVS